MGVGFSSTRIVSNTMAGQYISVHLSIFRSLPVSFAFVCAGHSDFHTILSRYECECVTQENTQERRHTFCFGRNARSHSPPLRPFILVAIKCLRFSTFVQVELSSAAQFLCCGVEQSIKFWTEMRTFITRVIKKIRKVCYMRFLRFYYTIPECKDIHVCVCVCGLYVYQPYAIRMCNSLILLCTNYNCIANWNNSIFQQNILWWSGRSLVHFIQLLFGTPRNGTHFYNSNSDHDF